MIVVNANLFMQQAEITSSAGDKIYLDLTALPSGLVDLAYAKNDFNIIIIESLPDTIYEDLKNQIHKIENHKFSENKIEIRGI